MGYKMCLPFFPPPLQLPTLTLKSPFFFSSKKIELVYFDLNAQHTITKDASLHV